MTTQTSDYWKLFKAGHCNLKLKGANKEAVLTELVETIVKAKVLDASKQEAATKALVEREKLASTGVGMNVAIPHVQVEGIDQVIVNISLHPEGVEWAALDGEPVHIFFTVLRPSKPGDSYDPERHLEMMRWLSRLCRHADFRRFAQSVNNRTELVELLKEMSSC